MQYGETPNLEERELIKRARAGDERAFNAIIDRYRRPVLDYVYRMLGDADMAQDLAQDVFVRVWRGLERYQPRRQAKFSTWLFQIARNLCVDTFRRRARDPLATGVTDFVDARLSAPESVMRDVSARETGARIAAAIADLPEDQRTAVVLTEYEGLSRRGIADIMQSTEKSVDARLYRARQTLKQRLRDLMAPR